MTPAQLVESTWMRLTGKEVFAGGRQRGFDVTLQEPLSAIQEVDDIPYLVYQYEGGEIEYAMGRVTRMDRRIVYVVWHKDLHLADDLELQFVSELLKSKRMLNLSSSFSFTDSSTGRTGIDRQIGGFHGVQRAVTIRS